MKNNSLNIDEVTSNLVESIIVLIAIILVVAAVGFAYFLNQTHNGNNQKDGLAIGCGTDSRMYAARSIHDSTKIDYVNWDLGKTLFRNNCAACHNKNMRDDLTGPALGGVTERWEAYPKEDLYEFIRNSQEMIKAKHPRAEQLWNDWEPVIMNAFEDLTDEEIEAVIAYIEYWP